MRVSLTRGRWRGCRGLSLIEVSLVIGLLLALMTMVGIGAGQVERWKRAREASVGAQAVLAAQRAYLADHPTTVVMPVGESGDVRFDLASMGSGGQPLALAAFAEVLSGYLPLGWSGIPDAQGVDDEPLVLDFLRIPPRWQHAGADYDPSATANDGLWDAGE